MMFKLVGYLLLSASGIHAFVVLNNGPQIPPPRILLNNVIQLQSNLNTVEESDRTQNRRRAIQTVATVVAGGLFSPALLPTFSAEASGGATAGKYTYDSYAVIPYDTMRPYL